MKIKILVSISFGVFLVGCENSYQTEYFPHNKGMTWFYHINQLTMTEPVNYKMIITSHGTRLIEGTRNIIKQMHTGEILSYQLMETGLYRMTENQNDKPLFLFPLSEGTKWQSDERPYLMERSIDEINAQQNSMPGLSLNGDLNMEYTIESMNESVDVPAGRFHSCMKITGTGTCAFSSVGSFAKKINVNVNHSDWYCPDVGLVKVERKEETERVSLKSVYYTIELERYHH